MSSKGKTVLANKNLPNYITTIRIIGTAALLFMKPLSNMFLIVYAIAGVTDAIDGFIARKMGTISEFGSKLDSIADLLLYFVMIVKLFPVMWVKLPHKIWLLVASVVFLRLCSYVYVAKKFHVLSAQHTYLNKVSGLLAFGIPFAMLTPYAAPYCWTLGAVTMTGTLEELTIHIISREYNPRRKTLLSKV